MGEAKMAIITIHRKQIVNVNLKPFQILGTAK
jgi:hypothetical protein